MAHVDQRLGERVVSAEADRAYALLRNRKALAAVIGAIIEQHPEWNRPPRVALALTGSRSPPHLLVTGDGHAVTCLASGMAVGVPQVPYELVSIYLEEQERSFREQRAMARLEDSPDDRASVYGLINRSHEMTRADFDVLRALAPLLVPRAIENVVHMTNEVVALRRHSARQTMYRTMREAEGAWKRYTRACLLLMATAPETDMDRALFLAALARDVMLSSRALWWLVNRPERTMDVIEHSLETKGPIGVHEVYLPLIGIAVRFDWLASRARKVFRACLDAEGVPPAGLEAWFENLTGEGTCRKELDESLPVPLVAVLAENGLKDLIPSPALWDEQLTRQRGDVLKAASGCSEEFGRWFEIWNPYRDFERLQDTHPRPHDRVPEEDHVRGLCWNRVIQCSPRGNGFGNEPWMVLRTAAPIEAFIPLDQVDPLLRANYGGEYMLHSLQRIMRPDGPPKPKTVAAQTGRNEPCPCGSGKKYKKCCGA